MTAPPIKLRGPADLLAVIPHLLGFQPQHAIVVMALRDNKIDLTERIDLPAPERVGEVAEALVRHVRRETAEAALLVGYEDTAGESRPILEALTQQLPAQGVSIRDRLVVHDGRWRSLDCDRPSCCPPGGMPLSQRAGSPPRTPQRPCSPSRKPARRRLDRSGGGRQSGVGLPSLGARRHRATNPMTDHGRLPRRRDGRSRPGVLFCVQESEPRRP